MLATESGARRGGEVKRRNADSSVWTAYQSPEGLRHTLGGGRRVGESRETEGNSAELMGGGGGLPRSAEKERKSQSINQSVSQFGGFFFERERVDR